MLGRASKVQVAILKKKAIPRKHRHDKMNCIFILDTDAPRTWLACPEKK